MKIPGNVKIGGIDYKIEKSNNIWDGSVLLDGDIQYGQAIIRLNCDTMKSHDRICSVLWHEILHGIATHANLKLPQEEAETIIDTLANGIYQVIKDNKELFDND